MLLSLHRVGWRADNVALWRDDRDRVVDLLYTSPALVAKQLQAGVLRALERKVASSLDDFNDAR
eukprot:9480520-Pyramimonas_sp.AAC.1